MRKVDIVSYASRCLYTDERRHARGYTTCARANAAIKKMGLSHEHLSFPDDYRRPMFTTWTIRVRYGATQYFVEKA